VIDYTANSKENILLKVMYRMRVVQSGVWINYKFYFE
jgi:hypothetical protein